jgi:VIT1/CCC1 family predicted Fe2+/Mn2+ transporter
MEYWLYGFTTIFLIILGAIAAKTGGSSIQKAIIRITIWGTLAMGLSALRRLYIWCESIILIIKIH